MQPQCRRRHVSDMLVRTMSDSTYAHAPGPQQAGLSDFSTLFNFLPIGAYRSLPGGLQLRANPALVRLNGYDSENEMLLAVHDIGREWYVQPQRREDFREELKRCGHVRGFVSEVYRHRTRERIWISENAHVVHDAAGVVLFYEGTVEEITDSVNAAMALQRSESHLRQIAHHVPGMVYRVHRARSGVLRYSFVSDGVLDLYGIAAQALMSDPLVLRRFRHPEDIERLDHEVAQAYASQGPISVEYRIVLDDGRIKWLHTYSSAAANEGDEQVRVGVAIDVTARRDSDALRGERDRAEAANREMTQFLSRVSHELRTPLNAILGFSQLLDTDAATPAQQRPWVHEILLSGRHLLGLVTDILDLTGAQSGRIWLKSLDLEDLDLATALAECQTMLAQDAAVMQLLVHNTVVAGAVPRVRADRRRLKQVLVNLLSNAIKYNCRGGVLSLVARQRDAMIELDVVDTGMGLDGAQLERLFNPFDRLGAQRGTVPGTGLGLALSRQLAQAMGGEIRVQSRPGLGSTFTLVLPVAAGEIAANAARI